MSMPYAHRFYPSVLPMVGLTRLSLTPSFSPITLAPTHLHDTSTRRPNAQT